MQDQTQTDHNFSCVQLKLIGKYDSNSVFYIWIEKLRGPGATSASIPLGHSGPCNEEGDRSTMAHVFWMSSLVYNDLSYCFRRAAS